MAGATVLIAATTAATLFGSQMSSDDIKYWYDFFHNYYIFGEEYTDIIDQILMDPNYARVGPTRVIAAGKRVPGVGVHYFYKYSKSMRTFAFGKKYLYYRRFYTGVEKVREEVGDTVSYYYMLWVRPTTKGEEMFHLFEEKVATPRDGSVRVISIDTSGFAPRLVWLTKRCRTPRMNQGQAITGILERWTIDTDFNTKVLIHGIRGVGKTHTALLLKKQIDADVPNAYVKVYDDFDPTAIGVNIRTLALKDASPHTPIILVINEIDSVFEKVMDPAEPHDPREQHARSKQSFNNMLDAIDSTPYVIAIFTSEKSPADMRENPNYRSFLRPGRVDVIVHMTADESIVTDNELPPM